MCGDCLNGFGRRYRDRTGVFSRTSGRRRSVRRVVDRRPARCVRKGHRLRTGVASRGRTDGRRSHGGCRSTNNWRTSSHKKNQGLGQQGNDTRRAIHPEALSAQGHATMPRLRLATNARQQR